MNILAPEPDYLNRGIKFNNEPIEMRVQYLRPSCICLKNRDDSKLTKAEKGTILDDILSEGLALKKEKDKKEEMTIAKMEIPEEQVHFIVSIFGPKPMVSGDISFISCLT